MAWYREWFGKDYLDLYSHRDRGEAERSVATVVGWLGPERPRAVLDLACGAGRHTEALRQRGLRALGVDLSLTLLATRPDLPRVCGDMRGLPFAAASFDWILNFFTSFGYFESERENFRVLEEIVRLLTPGGRFVIDFLNRDRVLAALTPSETVEEDDRRIEVQRWYDPVTCRINKRITIHPRGRPARTFLESVRAYSREEVTIGISWAGLEVTDTFGNFHGEPFESDSERLIFVGRKPR
ncbi:MAG TPA: class I SAM-dependent methyltransferase [Thermoanaerobaculia bacterium]|nr:class I SAM-dependent methyltransferase [Thermoanaerobaculia bacterium]